MEENVSPEFSLAPEPEQSQDPMDSCSEAIAEEKKEETAEQDANTSEEKLEEPEKSCKATSEVRKTWRFRRTTIAKREMPGEAATKTPESSGPVRRSGRQAKRTDKLEEFLSTTKRGGRKSAPASIESGDPPSQTPTDAETASEASFDGNAEVKTADDMAESPERRTRSGARKNTPGKAGGGRRTRGGRGTAKDEGSSENEEDGIEDAPQQPQDKDEEKNAEEKEAVPEEVAATDSAQPQPEQECAQIEVEEKTGEEDEKEKDEQRETELVKEEESDEKPPSSFAKRAPIRTYTNKKRATANKNAAPANTTPAPVKREIKPKVVQAAAKTRKVQENEDNEDSLTSTSSSSSSSSPESDEGGYDPNALYCICRQKHNKRFMICCDRCEEWFHGDCVGITEARGRLMERNGEDYICPNCTAKKNQLVKPATTAVDMENSKPKADALAHPTALVASAAALAESRIADLSPSASPSVASSTPAGTEEKAVDDPGIKGRIEKAINPTGKKRIKIFQPQAVQQAAEQKAQQMVPPKVESKASPNAEQKLASNTEQKAAPMMEQKAEPEVAPEVEEKVVEKAEEASLPKCIGPGCENNAQPDSVYCGNDCILRHAAAAMRSITDVKDSRQKDKAKAKAQKKAGSRSTPKRSATGAKKTRRKTTEDDESDSEEDHDSEAVDDDGDEDEHAVEHPPPPAAASWSSDHNYNAVTPEKTAPISATVLNKTSPPKEEKEIEKEHKEKEVSPAEKSSPVSTTPVKGTKKSPGPKRAKTTPKGKKSSPKTAGSKSSKKTVTPPSKMAAKSKKTPPPPPSPYPAGPIHITGALRVTKSNFTIPKKQPQPRDSSSHSQSSSSSLSRVPSSVSSAPPNHSHSSSSRPPPPATSAPPMHPPNNQMRQNIRRSLTDILYKRVSDSDDLNMTESEVARLAVAIEKEMFNLCLNTDSKYKNKYRSLMFNLKDPKNKGLFYRVVWGEVSPFRLVRLSAEELLSKEISEWRKSDPSEAHITSSRAHSGLSKSGHRRESGSHNVDMEDAPPSSDGDVCISGTSPSPRMASAAEQEESSFTPSVSAQASSVEGNSGGSMPDIFSSMLKDTTAEHKTHLFDLNCKICTGQKLDDEPAAKKAKLIKRPEARPHYSRSSSSDVSLAYQPQAPTAFQHQVYQPQDPLVYQHQSPPAYQPSMEVPASEPQPLPQLYLEDLKSTVPPPQAPAPVTIPTVSSVTITRRDPRMARLSSGVTVTHTVPETPVVMPVVMPAVMPATAEPPSAPVAAPVEVAPKVPLPMPPAPPPTMAVSKSAKNSSAEPPPEGETAIFLHGQEKIWKGFINMQSVAKFVTKAYLVSGSFEHLKEDLPDTIHVGGRISPSTVWDYVGKLKTSLSKELCLIRFHPATEEEEVAYVSLFSYFSSRKRFGVVANNNRRIKDLYLIPLSAKDPLPSKLLPFDGPGLEPARPNLLLGLLICQKDRKRSGTLLEAEEKRSKIQTKDVDETPLPKPSTSIKVEKDIQQSLEIPFSTIPPGSPLPLSSSETPSSTTVTASSVLSLLSSVKASATSTGKDSPSSTSSVASSAASATPLQTILNTLFGKKKHDSEASNSPSDQGGEVSVPPATILDPIVQQFGQISKEKPVEEDEDDRPYDPEEEYDPSICYSAPKKPTEVAKEPEVSKQPDGMAAEVDDVDDVAYDPEDDSIFEEAKTTAPGQAKNTSVCIIEPQKILEKFSKQNKEHEEPTHLQISSIGASAASFSVTDTLLTQPVSSLLANSQLLQLGKKVEELVKASSIAPLINQRRDPRQSRDPRQAATTRNQTSKAEETEETPARFTETTLPLQPAVQEVESPKVEIAEDTDPSLESETPQPQEEVESEPLPFLESDKAEVSIPLLGEQVEPDMEVNYIEMKQGKPEEAEPTEAESEMDKYSIWPNAASVLKGGEDSMYEQNSPDSTSSSYFDTPSNTSTVTSTIPVLTQSTTMGDTHSSHLPHMSTSGFQKEYRPPADIPPPASFPLPQLGPPLMQGPPPMLRPPPMSVPTPIQGLPPMSGPLPIHGPPPPMHVPPLMRGPPPMQGDGNQQYGPPPGAYPPYQGQWGSSQQQPLPGPPPQNMIPPRGPPPLFPPMGQRAPPPQMFDPSLPPQHMGQQGPPPGLPLPPTFDGQNSLPLPRFSGPPPPFNFPGSRGPPPPPFTGPPPGHFDTRLPPPSHFPGPRGPITPMPSQYGDHGPQTPMIDSPRGPVDQYNKDGGGSYKQGMDQHQTPNPPHMYKDKQPPPPGPSYRGAPPNQYEDRRGPAPSVEMGGQHFHPHNQYGGSRPHSPPPHRGSFDDLRGPPQDNRGPPPQHFGGSERYHLDRHSDDMRPVRHSGPLLPTPSEGPIPPPSRMGGHSPDGHREDHWRRHSPDMRRRSSSTREGSEPRSGDRPSRFEGGSREPAPSSSHHPEEKQRELSEDHRRDREREGPHGGRPSWDRSQGKRWSREQEWDRPRERERDGERSRERARSRGREGERHREVEVERHRDPESDKRRERDRERGRERDPDRRDPDRRDHERDRPKIRERDRERDKERDRRRDRSRSRDRDHGKDRAKDRDRERDRDRDKDRDRRDRSRSREKREDKKESKHNIAKSDKSSEKEKDKNKP